MMEWTLPTFFTPAVLDDMTGVVKMLLIFGGPLIMIIVALFAAEGVIGYILDMFAKNKEQTKKDEEDDFEVYHYKS